MEEESKAKVRVAAPASTVEPPPLDSGIAIGLKLLGLMLVLASLAFGFFWMIGFGVGLSEPGRPSGTRQALAGTYALFGILLLVTGVVSMLCRDKGDLPGLGALAAATAATLALCLGLELLA